MGEEQKYVWHPVTGDELLVDLETDPLEEENLADDPDYAADLQQWRDRLADRLSDRLEDFVVDGELRTADPEAWHERYTS